MSSAAALAAVDGDAGATRRNLIALIRVARQTLESSRFQIEMLVGMAILALADSTLRLVLDQSEVTFSVDDLAAIEAEIAAIPDAAFRPDPEELRRRCAALVALVYTDDGAGDGRLTADGLVLTVWGCRELEHKPVASTAPWIHLGLGLPSRREAAAAIEEQIAYIAARSAEPILPGRGLTATGPWRRIRTDQPLLAWIDEALLLAEVVEIGKVARGMRDAMRLRTALARQTLLDGREPESLAGLTGIDPAALRDPFDGRPIRTALREGRLVVYSIGYDGKDDGGRAAITYTDRGVEIGPDPVAARHPVGQPDGDWIWAGPHQ
jgi:hypothetical protein